MPGKTKTAGLLPAGIPSSANRARSPTGDFPAQDSGPITANPGGSDRVSASTTASAVRSFAK